MPAPEEIEAMLQRLMPTALSPLAQEEMDAIFEEAASGVPSRKSWVSRYWIPSSLAAAVGFALLLVPFTKKMPVSVAAAAAPSPGLVLVNSSDRVEEVADEGEDGTTQGEEMHAVRLQMVAENTVKDQETGIEMLVSEPREELVLVPVTAF
jgi:hypothetical protein